MLGYSPLWTEWLTDWLIDSENITLQQFTVSPMVFLLAQTTWVWFPVQAGVSPLLRVEMLGSISIKYQPYVEEQYGMQILLPGDNGYIKFN